MMRKLLVAAMTAGLMAVAAPAFAGSGPAGTSEGYTTTDDKGTPDPSDDTTTQVEDNQVDCGTADDDDVDAGNGIQLKTEGDQAAPQNGGALVLCNDGEVSPIQGRIIATGDADGGYVAADGDADNPDEATGYAKLTVRIGTETPLVLRCGDTAGNDTDSANQAGNSAPCGA